MACAREDSSVNFEPSGAMRHWECRLGQFYGTHQTSEIARISCCVDSHVRGFCWSQILEHSTQWRTVNSVASGAHACRSLVFWPLPLHFCPEGPERADDSPVRLASIIIIIQHHSACFCVKRRKQRAPSGSQHEGYCLQPSDCLVLLENGCRSHRNETRCCNWNSRHTEESCGGRTALSVAQIQLSMGSFMGISRRGAYESKQKCWCVVALLVSLVQTRTFATTPWRKTLDAVYKWDRSITHVSSNTLHADTNAGFK